MIFSDFYRIHSKSPHFFGICSYFNKFCIKQISALFTILYLLHSLCADFPNNLKILLNIFWILAKYCVFSPEVVCISFQFKLASWFILISARFWHFCDFFKRIYRYYNILIFVVWFSNFFCRLSISNKFLNSPNFFLDSLACSLFCIPKFERNSHVFTLYCDVFLLC